ncbi:hypothetical protein AVEN_88416-1 [Araneus ventricosus]|uniref:Uncharacterized protein n=1 Tax=Araneus ventricosus TaxID=182803 RepID=A0A4Y2RTM8_ARAVE|nr:hypothetical protein AVEN_54214-1 [Araneus ventricosus]GBN78629.1 hypothetical protein AVEN_88416-1 [Araneus ventricosus]
MTNYVSISKYCSIKRHKRDLNSSQAEAIQERVFCREATQPARGHQRKSKSCQKGKNRGPAAGSFTTRLFGVSNSQGTFTERSTLTHRTSKGDYQPNRQDKLIIFQYQKSFYTTTNFKHQ